MAHTHTHTHARTCACRVSVWLCSRPTHKVFICLTGVTICFLFSTVLCEGGFNWQTPIQRQIQLEIDWGAGTKPPMAGQNHWNGGTLCREQQQIINVEGMQAVLQLVRLPLFTFYKCRNDWPMHVFSVCLRMTCNAVFKNLVWFDGLIWFFLIGTKKGKTKERTS